MGILDDISAGDARSSILDRLSSGQPVDPAETAQADLDFTHKEGEFVKGLRRFGYSSIATSKAFAAQMLEPFSPTTSADVMQSARGTLQEQEEANIAPRVGEFGKAQSLRDYADWAAAGLGEGLPSVGLMAAGALAGAGAGAGTGAVASGLRGAFKGGLRGAAGGAGRGAVAGAELGAKAGAVGSMLPLEGGETALSLQDDPVAMANTTPEERALLALGRGGVNAALESVVPMGMVAPRLLGRAARTAPGVLPALGNAAKLGAAGAIGEYGTEAAQELTGQAVSQYANPAKSFDLGEAHEAGLKGALTGAVLGGAGAAGQAVHSNIGAAADKAKEKISKVTGDFSVEGVVEKLKLAHEDPEAFGAQAGEMTLGAIDAAAKQVGVMADYAKGKVGEGLEGAGGVVDRLTDAAHGYLAGKIEKPENRQWLAERMAEFNNMTGPEFRAFKAAFQEKTGMEFQEHIGASARLFSENLKQAGERGFKWVSKIAKGFKEGVAPEGKQSLKLGKYSENDRKYFRDELAAASPEISRMLKKATINEQRELTDFLLAATEDASYFAKPGKDPIRAALIDGWRKTTGTDLTKVLEAVRSKQRVSFRDLVQQQEEVVQQEMVDTPEGVVAATPKGGRSRVDEARTFDADGHELFPANPELSPFNAQRLRESMSSDVKEHNLPGTRIPIKLEAQGIPPSVLARAFPNRFPAFKGKKEEFRPRANVDDNLTHLPINVNPMSLSMMAAKGDNQAAMASSVPMYEEGQSKNVRAGDRMSGAIAELATTGVDIKGSDLNLTPEEQAKYGVGPDDDVHITVDMDEDALQQDLVINRASGEESYRLSDYQKGRATKRSPVPLEQVRAQMDVLASLGEDFTGVSARLDATRKTDSPAVKAAKGKLWGAAKGVLRDTHPAVTEDTENYEDLLDEAYKKVAESVTDRYVGRSSRAELESVREAYKDGTLTDTDIYQMVSYYQGTEAKVPKAFEKLDLKPMTMRQAEQASLLEDAKEQVDQAEEKSGAISGGRGEEAVDALKEEFEAFKIAPLSKANMENTGGPKGPTLPPEVLGAWAADMRKRYTDGTPYAFRSGNHVEGAFATQAEARAAAAKFAEGMAAADARAKSEGRLKGSEESRAAQAEATKPKIIDVRPREISPVGELQVGSRVETLAEFEAFLKKVNAAPPVKPDKSTPKTDATYARRLKAQQAHYASMLESIDQFAAEGAKLDATNKTRLERRAQEVVERQEKANPVDPASRTPEDRRERIETLKARSVVRRTREAQSVARKAVLKERAGGGPGVIKQGEFKPAEKPEAPKAFGDPIKAAQRSAKDTARRLRNEKADAARAAKIAKQKEITKNTEAARAIYRALAPLLRDGTAAIVKQAQKAYTTLARNLPPGVERAQQVSAREAAVEKLKEALDPKGEQMIRAVKEAAAEGKTPEEVVGLIKKSMRSMYDQLVDMETQTAARHDAAAAAVGKIQEGVRSASKTIKEAKGKRPTPEFDKLPSYTPGQKNMVYAGIGSRDTPADVMELMTKAAKFLEERGYTLRSGGADGADTAFAAGASKGKREIFKSSQATDQTRAIAQEIHPMGGNLDLQRGLNLHARNTNQIFGARLDTPADFVLVWTKNGAESSAERGGAGGSGQAIDMASRKGIPVINLAKDGWRDKLKDVLRAGKNLPAKPVGKQSSLIKPPSKDESTVEREAIQAEALTKAEKELKASEAYKKILASVQKMMGHRVEVKLVDNLHEDVAAQYVTAEETLKSVRDTRRSYIDELAIVPQDRLSKKSDAQLRAGIKEMEAKEKAILADEVTKGFIEISSGAVEQHGLAEHETMHAAFDLFFTNQERSDLALAFSQGTVYKKLKEHFKDEPEVLKAMERDPEEAAAYGFQLWHADHDFLKVGDKVKTLFERFHDWVRKVLKIMTPEERAEALLRHLSSGGYAEKGTGPVARVLDKDKPWADRALKFAKDIGGLVEKGTDILLTGTYDRLLKVENPLITRIAKLGYEQTGEDSNSGGMIQRQRHEFKRRINQLDRILKGLDEEQLKKLNDALIFDKATGDVTIDAAKKQMNGLYEEMLEYQQKAEVSITPSKDEGNYFPLPFDPEKVLKDKKAFIEMLSQDKYKEKMTTEVHKTPEEIYEGIVAYIDRGDELVNVMGEDNEPLSEHARARTLGFLDKEDRRPFMADEPVQTTVHYIKQAVRQAEFVRSFGEKGTKLDAMIADAKDRYNATDDDIALVRDYIDGLMGNKEVGMSRELKDLYGAVNVYQNYRLLPFNLFTSLIDPLGIAIRSNSIKDAFSTFTYSMKNLFRDWKKEYKPDQWEELANDWGIIEASGTTINAQAMYDGITLRGTTKSLNDKLFKYNLLNGWIRSNTIMAVKASQFFFRRAAEGKFGKERSARYLEEVGLAKEDIVWNDKADRLAVTVPELVASGMSEEKAEETVTKLRNATEKFVRQSLLAPSSAELPNWASNPYLMPIAHLKQFVWSFNSTITGRLKHEASHGNYTPILLAAAYVPGMIAADWMKDMVSNMGEEPPYKQGWGVADYLKAGALRSGLAGTGAFLDSASGDITRGGSGYESFAGPAAQQAQRGVRAFTSGDSEAIRNWIVKSGPLMPVYDQFLLSGGSSQSGVTTN